MSEYSKSSQVGVLFVCMGNICRSPSAEGVFRHRVEEAGLSGVIYIDSAGTHNYHVGGPPDKRSAAAALKRGYDLSTLRARQVEATDFEVFNYVLAMDDENFTHLLRLARQEYHNKIHRFMTFAPQLNLTEVPDPYYGGADGFEHVLDLVEAAADGLLAHIQEQHLAAKTG